MAYKRLVAFGAGEITPELGERNNLDKFNTGLKTLRNCIVTKFGGLRSRRGTCWTGPDTAAVVSYYTPYHTVVNRDVMFQFYKDCVKVHTGFNGRTFNSFETSLLADEYTEDELRALHFSNDDKHLYVFSKTNETIRISLDSPYSIESVNNFDPPDNLNPPGLLWPVFLGCDPESTPSGYDIEYCFTTVKDGVESFVLETITKYTTSLNQIKLPDGTNQQNRLRIAYEDGTSILEKDLPDEVRVYRRPLNGGAWGFIGLATPVVSVGPHNTGDWLYQIFDVGQDTTLTDQPPDYISGFKLEKENFKASTGLIYQNRLLMSIKNKVYGSRTDYPTVMTRDFPLQDDSGVTFKTGSDGGANIGRMYDGRGLILSTNVGIYETPSDVLKYDTAFAIKRSSIVHDERIPIVGIGGRIFLSDKRLNGVFTLTPSGTDEQLVGQEISIFSSHLLDEKQIVSWVVQDDGTQTLWIVTNEGILLSASIQEDQQLVGWARHDFQKGKVEQALVIRQDNKGDVLLLVIIINGTRNVISMVERNLDVYNNVCTDYTITYNNQMIAPNRWLDVTNNDLGSDYFESGVLLYNGETDRTVADNIERNAIPMDERYEGMLVLSTGAMARYELVGGIDNSNWEVFSGPFNNMIPGLGGVGDILRFYNEETKEYTEYEVTAFNSNLSVEIQITTESLDRDFYKVMDTSGSFTIKNMYQTFKTLSGLGHLEGEKVAIRADGFTEASPLNKLRDYNTYTVSGAEVTLENRAAFVSVGLPIVSDIQTLDSESVEEVSAKTYSSIVNKVYVSYYKSRGLYVGYRFPSNDTNEGMEDHEEFFQPDEGIEPYKPHQPYSRREEVVLQGDWSAASSTAFRNVDPQPIGVRGFILDIDGAEE